MYNVKICCAEISNLYKWVILTGLKIIHGIIMDAERIPFSPWWESQFLALFSP